VIGGIVAVVMAVPVVRYLVFPVRRKVVDGPGDAIPVAAASVVTDNPTRVEIAVAQQRDAWAKVENVRLGAAWLVRDAKGEIRAFTSTCPHLGCSVDYDPQAGQFRCPCHKSAFTKDGQRVAGPAKRGLDPLEARVDDQGRVLVKFSRFKLDTPEREVA
jgi:quinol---cytochrome c reductase iron-sulfur subunit, bacillus type